uniref:EF-hand domain-containing protein n=1 Tax=Macrostomum lignano TaxID=282301 RepID=A0A1I8G7G0_9PLAT
SVYFQPQLSATSMDAKRRKKRRELSSEQKAEIKDAFELFDSDNDNAITYHEFKVALRALGFDLKKSEVAKLVQDYNVKDDSGKLSQADFTEILLDVLRRRRNSGLWNDSRIYYRLSPNFHAVNLLVSFDEAAVGPASVACDAAPPSAARHGAVRCAGEAVATVGEAESVLVASDALHAGADSRGGRVRAGARLETVENRSGDIAATTLVGERLGSRTVAALQSRVGHEVATVAAAAVAVLEVSRDVVV